MARGKSKTSDLQKQMEDLQGRMKEAKAEEEMKAGRLARKAGLLDLDLTDAAMAEAFRRLADTFRKDAAKGPAEAEPQDVEA